MLSSFLRAMISPPRISLTLFCAPVISLELRPPAQTFEEDGSSTSPDGAMFLARPGQRKIGPQAEEGRSNASDAVTLIPSQRRCGDQRVVRREGAQDSVSIVPPRPGDAIGGSARGSEMLPGQAVRGLPVDQRIAGGSMLLRAPGAPEGFLRTLPGKARGRPRNGMS